MNYIMNDKSLGLAVDGTGTILKHPNVNIWIEGAVIDYENNINYIKTLEKEE